jgi:PAS domain S-box-containing protein
MTRTSEPSEGNEQSGTVEARRDLTSGLEFRRFAEHAGDVLFRLRVKPLRVLEYLSPSIFELTGYTAEEISRHESAGAHLILADDRAALAERRDAFRLKQATHAYRIVHRSGDIRWSELRSWPVSDEAGETIAIEGIVRDITERRRAEAALQAREEQYRALFELGSHPIFLYDVETLRFLEVNTSAVKHYGYTREEFLAMSLFDIRPPSERVRFVEHSAVRREQPSVTGPWLHVKKDGTVISIMAHARSITFQERRARLVTIADVTEQLQAEAALRQAGSTLRLILEKLPGGLVVLNERGELTVVNSALAALLGYTEQELVGRLGEVVVPPELREGYLGRVRTLLEGGAVPPIEFQLLRKDGGRVDVELSSLSLELDGRRAILASVRDLTERKALHARLAVADRMVSVGTLAAGVAHEINNPMSFITMNLVYALGELGRFSQEWTLTGDQRSAVTELMSALQESRDGCVRVRQIVRDLKTFSRADDEDKREPVDVQRVIESCLNMAWTELRHRARLVKEFEPTLPIMANEGRLAQVVLNLVVNATQAMSEGTVDQNELRVVLRPRPEGGVLIEVRDTGCGIAPDVLPRIFDPFFTTKAINVGTGLGLSICRNIVASMGGAIQLETVVGRGTTFRIELPRQEPSARRKTEVVPAGAYPEKPTLLVVDDEAWVGSSMQRMLRDRFKVETMTSARQALDLIQGGARYDLVVSDLMMPEMTGMELHQALMLTVPEQGARMIFMTGGAFTAAADEFLKRHGRWSLEKPFDLAQVEALFAQALRELRAELK